MNQNQTKQQAIEQWCREFTANTPHPTIRVSAGGTMAVVSWADRCFVVTEFVDEYDPEPGPTFSALEVR